MDGRLLALVPKLNRYFIYRYLDEDTIDNIFYHAYMRQCPISTLAETKCGITSNVIAHLYGESTGKVDLADEAPNSSFGHSFTYIEDGDKVYVYESYARHYKVKMRTMTLSEFDTLLETYRTYLKNLDTKLLSQLTGVEQSILPMEPSLVVYPKETCPLLDPLQEAIKLVEEVQNMLSIPDPGPTDGSPYEYSDDMIVILADDSNGSLLEQAQHATSLLLTQLRSLIQ